MACGAVVIVPGRHRLSCTSARVWLLVSGCVFSHVDLSGVDGEGAVDDAVTDSVGVDACSETVVPVFDSVLRDEDGGSIVIARFSSSNAPQRWQTPLLANPFATHGGT